MLTQCAREVCTHSFLNIILLACHCQYISAVILPFACGIYNEWSCNLHNITKLLGTMPTPAPIVESLDTVQQNIVSSVIQDYWMGIDFINASTTNKTQDTWNIYRRLLKFVLLATYYQLMCAPTKAIVAESFWLACEIITYWYCNHICPQKSCVP